MKKFLIILLAIVLASSAFLALSGCKPKEKEADKFEIALVTDKGTIDDKSFNQGAWEGVVQYATEFKKTHKYYQPTNATNNDYIDAIDLAVKGGAKVVVCPGFLFEVAVYTCQTKYPDVNFILLDGAPHTEDYSVFKTEKNVASIFYAEEEAGFLAGYAAVMDGMTDLGFMGGMAVPPVVRFGYGFIQGADTAAQDLGLGEDAIKVRYHYTGDFKASPEIETMSAAWYSEGANVIFGCGGAVGNSVMAAAAKAGKKVIGVDVDQSSESPTVITSAMKQLKKSVYDNLKDLYDGKFKGGESQRFDAKVGGIGLPFENSKFDKFSKEDYDTLYARLVAGDFKILKDDQAGKEGDPTAADAEKGLQPLEAPRVKVIYI